MNTKSEIMKKAVNDIKHRKVVLYHILKPISKTELLQIQKDGYFKPSKNALGGQTDGYYFFTTYNGAKHHIENEKDMWEKDSDKHAYIVESEVDLSDVKYPKWKLDYEAMQDFMFDMIYNAAVDKVIKFADVEISATDNRKLNILYKGKFSRIKNFCANDHSGLIEKTADFLYVHDKQFKKSYDELLQDVFSGKGANQELYAVKTIQKQKITKITEIKNSPSAIPSASNSQIDKFLLRYAKTRH